jgi:hypothetical protein
VKSSVPQSPTTSTGVSLPASVATSFAVTQATWRFFANERVTPIALVAPLRNLARQQLVDAPYVLAVTDGSKLDFKRVSAGLSGLGTSKEERLLLQRKILGYLWKGKDVCATNCSGRAF